MNEIKISVKDINLEEKNENSETISVLLLAGEEEQTVKMKFQYNDDGLIWNVTILEDTFSALH
ncbi:MAG TPA: hypothetical protein DCZ20_02520 [Lachnospiraceae bacterium]|nr:hypothetical protein [Lachnospiraceae bacterium]